MPVIKSFGAKGSGRLKTYKISHFGNYEVNQTEIENLPILPFSEMYPGYPEPKIIK